MNLHRSVLSPKYYTVKEWKRFEKITDDYVIIDNEKYYLSMQEILCQKYQIILTDYKTKEEKVKEIIKNLKYTGLKLIKRARKKPVKTTEKKPRPQKITQTPKTDYSFLLGTNKPKKKRKKEPQKDYTFLTGKKRNYKLENRRQYR